MQIVIFKQPFKTLNLRDRQHANWTVFQEDRGPDGHGNREVMLNGVTVGWEPRATTKTLKTPLDAYGEG